MKTKVQNSTKMAICHTTVNHRKICNAPLDYLMCPLQMINDIEPLSLTLNGVNACFIHHPCNLENYSISHKSETGEPKNKQKNGPLENIFVHLYTGFGYKIQMAENLRQTSFTSGKSAPNGPANGPAVTYSKIQNRLSRAP